MKGMILIMKNNILTIIKKEFSRFFGDRRMVFTALILPGLMMYLTYTLMGNAMSENDTVGDDYIPVIYVQNMPASMEPLFLDAELPFQISENELDEKQQIKDETADLLIAFPDHFEEDIASYDPASGVTAPQVDLFYNSISTESGNMYQTVYALLDVYESTMANRFDVNAGEDSYDLADEGDTSAFLISIIMPMLIMAAIFSGCIALAPESIAGEKERNTIATLLVTPLKRRELALGKLISLSVLSLLCALSSTVGALLSLPNMYRAVGEMSLNIYSVSDYIYLGAVIFSTALLAVSLLSLVSAYAKTIKEATTAATPLMLIGMLVGITSMFGGGTQSATAYYLIPLYNAVLCISGIFSRSFQTTHIFLTIGTNIIYSAVLGFLLTKMFNSEKVMFNK